MKYLFFLTTFLSIVSTQLLGQTKKLDSLNKVIATTQVDTVKGRALCRLSKELRKLSLRGINEAPLCYSTRCNVNDSGDAIFISVRRAFFVNFELKPIMVDIITNTPNRLINVQNPSEFNTWTLPEIRKLGSR